MVVVVFPSVPVTARIGRGPPERSCSHSYAKSISVRTEIPISSARIITACCGDTPGDGTRTSTPARKPSTLASTARSTTVLFNSRPKERCSSFKLSSDITTVKPRSTSARATAVPASARPKTAAFVISTPCEIICDICEICDEEPHGNSNTNPRENPETNYHRGLRPANQFKVMMNWRHLE